MGWYHPERTRQRVTFKKRSKKPSFLLRVLPAAVMLGILAVATVNYSLFFQLERKMLQLALNDCPRCIACPTNDKIMYEVSVEKCCNCCANRFVLNHKMGWMMMTNQTVRRHFRGTVGRMDVKEAFQKPPSVYDQSQYRHYRENYREVVLTRNFIDAIVSGFLFHKSGRECTKRFVGKFPGARQNWTKWLHYNETATIVANHPPSQRETFCKYLKTAPTPVGMKVFMDFAISLWYESHLKYREQFGNLNATLFMCYDDFNDAGKRRDALEKAKRWFSHDYDDGTRPPVQDGRLSAAQCARLPKDGYLFKDLKFQRQTYTGEHATNHSVHLRDSLEALVKDYDKTFFGGFVARANELFGCSQIKYE